MLKHWRVWWATVLFILAYVLLAWFTPQRHLTQFLNILVLSISVAVVATYSPAWVQTMQKQKMDGPDALSLGIGCTWTAEIGQRIWSIIWRGLDQPDWMTHSPVLPFFLALTVMGGIHHITAPGSVNGIVPKRSWIILGCSLGVATLLALLVAAYGFRESRSTEWIVPGNYEDGYTEGGRYRRTTMPLRPSWWHPDPSP